MNYLWNELTILWNDLTILWNDLIWKYLTMERNDRILVTREGSLNDIMNARDQASELEGFSCKKTLVGNSEFNIRRSHHYLNSSENTFIHAPIDTLHSDNIYTFRKYI